MKVTIEVNVDEFGRLDEQGFKRAGLVLLNLCEGKLHSLADLWLHACHFIDRPEPIIQGDGTSTFPGVYSRYNNVLTKRLIRCSMEFDEETRDHLVRAKGTNDLDDETWDRFVGEG